MNEQFGGGTSEQTPRADVDPVPVVRRRGTVRLERDRVLRVGGLADTDGLRAFVSFIKYVVRVGRKIIKLEFNN